MRIRLVLFVNEEPPFVKTELMGSLVYARQLKASDEPVLGMIALETLGFYSDEEHSQHYPPPLGLLYPAKGNFVAFVGLTSSRAFLRRMVGAFRELVPFPSVGGTSPGIIPGIDWSDHWSLEQVGIPALMITDTAPFHYPHYHTSADSPDKVDYDRLARVVSGLGQVIRQWALEGTASPRRQRAGAPPGVQGQSLQGPPAAMIGSAADPVSPLVITERHRNGLSSLAVGLTFSVATWSHDEVST